MIRRSLPQLYRAGVRTNCSRLISSDPYITLAWRRSVSSLSSFPVLNSLKVRFQTSNDNATKIRLNSCMWLINGTQSRCGSTVPEQDFGGTDTGVGGTYKADPEAEDEFRMKLKILGAALIHVNSCGWSMDALKAGAGDLGFSESAASLCTPYDLVEYFQRLSNHRLEIHLKEMDQKDKSLYSSVEYRLRLVMPFIDRYHQAMGLLADPGNVPRSLKVLRELSDIICINGLGDKSSDLRWYTKRALITSLYVATECYMVQDKSVDFKETLEFLERRVKDYELSEKAGSLAGPLVEAGFTTALNIFGLNKKR